MSIADIYSPLFRLASQNRQGENFSTEAFVSLIRVLLERENGLGRKLLGWLCFKDEDIFTNRTPTIGTQLHTRHGKPDIYIMAPGFLILVEVKKGSELHCGQLSQYDKILRERKSENRSLTTRLVLLTAFEPILSSTEPPHRPVRWSEVADWLEPRLPNIRDVVTVWLIQQFLAFLRIQVMTIEKVDWQYVEGAKSLLNLTTMLAKALELAQIKQTRSSAAWNYLGYFTIVQQPVCKSANFVKAG